MRWDCAFFPRSGPSILLPHFTWRRCSHSTANWWNLCDAIDPTVKYLRSIDYRNFCSACTNIPFLCNWLCVRATQQIVFRHVCTIDSNPGTDISAIVEWHGIKCTRTHSHRKSTHTPANGDASRALNPGQKLIEFTLLIEAKNFNLFVYSGTVG